MAAATDAPVENEPPSKTTPEHAERTPEEGIDVSDLADQDPNDEALESRELEGGLSEELHEEEIAAAADATIESESSSKAASEYAEDIPLALLESEPSPDPAPQEADETPDEGCNGLDLADKDPNDEVLEREELEGELEGEPEEEDSRSDSLSDAAIEAEVAQEGDGAEEERHENLGGKYHTSCE